MTPREILEELKIGKQVKGSIGDILSKKETAEITQALAQLREAVEKALPGEVVTNPNDVLREHP